jgi:hypothetical protein
MYEYISVGCFSTRRSVVESFLRSIYLDISIQEQVARLEVRRTHLWPSFSPTRPIVIHVERHQPKHCDVKTDIPTRIETLVRILHEETGQRNFDEVQLWAYKKM